MPSRELNVIDFDAPYDDPQAIGSIAAHSLAVCQNEIPAFQVDVGKDRHLAGSFVVRAIIEQAVNEQFGEVFAEHGYPPFRFMGEAMRAPYYADPSHARITSLRPHRDTEQICLALHKEYPGQPTPVGFGYARKGVELPTKEAYVPDDKGVRPYVNVAYEGETTATRLTAFSQGFALGGMEAAVHHYDRVPDQVVGGRWRRFFMNDPVVKDFSALPDFDQFVAMRQAVSRHLDYKQWLLLQQELQQSGDTIPDVQREELTALTADHLKDHPGSQYQFWEMRELVESDSPLEPLNIRNIEYGVTGGEFSHGSRYDFILPRKA